MNKEKHLCRAHHITYVFLTRSADFFLPYLNINTQLEALSHRAQNLIIDRNPLDLDD